jgi:hypothetical protein
MPIDQYTNQITSSILWINRPKKDLAKFKISQHTL